MRYDPDGGVRTLRGCVNDVNAMHQLLVERYAVPAANIRVLTNKQAKYKAIKESFRRHLIGNARKWKEAGSAAPAPAFLFHYSGHGSQARDETGTEPDGLDETLVTYNSRTPGVYDLKDWELGQLIEDLNEFSDNVTITFRLWVARGARSGGADPSLPARSAPAVKTPTRGPAHRADPRGQRRQLGSRRETCAVGRLSRP
jgi:hypothetical protein